jgi:hypothetical protein
VNHTSGRQGCNSARARGACREGGPELQSLSLAQRRSGRSAIAPTGAGAAILTVDTSCTDPLFTAGSGGVSSLDFRSTLYTGSLADGFGDTLDRTREGYVEMIEMATLTGRELRRCEPQTGGAPANCAAIRAANSPAVARPTGGLSGTLTLINVASGMDFTANAEALADLGTARSSAPRSIPIPILRRTRSIR